MEIDEGEVVEGLANLDVPELAPEGAEVLFAELVLDTVALGAAVVAVVDELPVGSGRVGAPPPASPGGANRVLGAAITCGVKAVD